MRRKKVDGNDGAFASESQDFAQKGLTKREYFAAAALQGICANLKCSAASAEASGGDAVTVSAAIISVRASDALIEALIREGGK